jgi:hypothetical protein
LNPERVKATTGMAGMKLVKRFEGRTRAVRKRFSLARPTKKVFMPIKGILCHIIREKDKERERYTGDKCVKEHQVLYQEYL